MQLASNRVKDIPPGYNKEAGTGGRVFRELFDCRTAIELNHIGQDAGVLFPVSSVPGTSEYTGKSFYAAPGFLIRKAIRQFAQCAQRAASVGFDAVEINASGRSFIASKFHYLHGRFAIQRSGRLVGQYDLGFRDQYQGG